MGFGFVEVGTVTPEPQGGNEKPRLFRLDEDKAVINRFGFNSDGGDIVVERVKNIISSRTRDRLASRMILGVNIGKNKMSEDAVKDFETGAIKFGPYADYLVINVSSPNTPGLRKYQNKEELSKIIERCKKALLPNSPLLFLKIAPDLTDEQKKDIADVCMDKKIDGLIICNTTVSRPNLISSKKDETGGLSGLPLKDMSTRLVFEMYKLTMGKIPIIASGGVFTGKDALEKITAGASLVQIYSSFIYEGPKICRKIKSELSCLIKNLGFHDITEAVGYDHYFTEYPSKRIGKSEKRL
eukprot:GHVL01006058.1.p1 GENE.GHVL01006058.1~~GHVL01006058.1.p1  ORF type:complete len:298 (+),score=79.78 GHVL01006058.1:797-1690(+)